MILRGPLAPLSCHDCSRGSLRRISFWRPSNKRIAISANWHLWNNFRQIGEAGGILSVGAIRLLVGKPRYRGKGTCPDGADRS